MESSCFAYIPPSFYILKTWVKKHSDFKQLRVQSLVTAAEIPGETPLHFKEITIVENSPTTIRTTSTDDFGKYLFRQTRTSETMSLLAKLLFSSNAELVAEQLKSFEIPVKTEKDLLVLPTEPERWAQEKQFLTRWNTTMAWVIGNQEPKGKLGPQIWFEKDSFLPLRIIYAPQRDGDWLDIQFENYQVSRGISFPRVIRVLKKDGSTLLNIRVTDVSTSFRKDSGHLANGFTPLGEDTPGSLKEMIQRYYEFLR